MASKRGTLALVHKDGTGDDDVDVKRAARRSLTIIEYFRQLDGDIPSQQVAIFLTVAAAKRPLPMKELEKMTGVSGSSMSRHLAQLSDIGLRTKGRPFRPGYELIQYHEDPEDRRIKVAALSPKGERFMRTLAQLL